MNVRLSFRSIITLLCGSVSIVSVILILVNFKAYKDNGLISGLLTLFLYSFVLALGNLIVLLTSKKK